MAWTAAKIPDQSSAVEFGVVVAPQHGWTAA
jgi:hypothetical protein